VSTNRHTTATGLCYEEAGVVTGDAAVGWLALWLIMTQTMMASRGRGKQTWESGMGGRWGLKFKLRLPVARLPANDRKDVYGTGK
jgi:hypothetical protein